MPHPGRPARRRTRSAALRGLLAALSLVGGTLVGAASATAENPAAQSVGSGNARLEAPTTLRPGEGVGVAVEGFTPGAEVQLFLMGPGPSARLLRPSRGSAVADAGGRARWTVRIPEDLVPDVGSASGWWLSADDLAGRFANQPLAPLGGAPAPVRPSSLVVESFDLGNPPAPVITARVTPPAPEPARATAQAAGPVASGAAPEARPVAPAPRPGVRWATVRDPAATARVPAERTFTTSVGLRVRSGPSVEAPLLTSVEPRSSLRLLSEKAIETDEADFFRVQLPDGRTGFAAPDPDDVAPALAGRGQGAYRLRVSPSSAAAARALISVGTPVRVQAVLDVDDPLGGPEVWVRVELDLWTGELVDGYLPALVVRPDDQ